MRLAWLSIVLAAACGGPPPAKVPEPVSGPDLSPALAPVRWMVGDWEHEGGREHWVATAGAFYGVGFLADGGFEAMIIDDAPEDSDGKPDNTLRLYAMPDGAGATLFTATASGATELRFENPTHDPKVIAYAPADDALTATVTGPDGDLVIPMSSIAAEPFDEASAADAAFALATDTDGVDGWVAHFADGGAMMRQGKRLEGDAIRAHMGPLLARADLLWEPIWSRSSPDGRLAATVGRARVVTNAHVTWRGSYLTIWRASADGWQVLLDVGRNEHPLE